MARSISDNSWEGITRLSGAAGAKFPELVAAQWALESGWGKTPSGKHNHFGLKGPGTAKTTTEYVDGKPITISDQFLDFANLKACVEYLVERWYKDWDGHKGVNRNRSRGEAARDLVKQGYATDPKYAEKLIKLMEDHAEPVAAATPAVQSGTDASKPVGRIEALRDTFLKRRPVQASALGVTDTVEVARGRVYAVVSWREQVADAHVEVELGHGAGTWFIWQPHWRELRDQPAAAVVSGAPEIDWGNFDARVTPNLTVGEVLQKDRRRIPPAGAAVRSRLVATAREFQRVRDAWGRPLGVTSFYRPEPINSQKGGARNSRHVTGQAFDIYPIGASIDTFYDWIRVRWRGGLGDGRPRGFVHLDTDGGGFVPGAGARPSRWWNY